MLLKFRKAKGDIKEGYYLNGLFLHRYKTDAIKILRANFKDFSQEEKEKYPIEWGCIHSEWKKATARTERIRKANERSRAIRKALNPQEQIKIKNISLNKVWREINHLKNNNINYNLLNERLNRMEEYIKVIEQDKLKGSDINGLFKG